MDKLVDAYNPATVEGLMCRHHIHINPQGRLYDCDFNHALDLRTPVPPIARRQSPSTHPIAPLGRDCRATQDRLIATADHCYGCTAGTGSSCGGSLV